MKTLCEKDCCSQCPQKDVCGGCLATGGHPFGGSCIAAECIKTSGKEAFQRLQRELIEEFNELGIPNLHVESLNLINGFYVNLEYPLDNGQSVKLLKDENIYLGNQIEVPGGGTYLGIVADERYLLVCEYKSGGTEPQILCYKRRKNC